MLKLDPEHSSRKKSIFRTVSFFKSSSLLLFLLFPFFLWFQWTLLSSAKVKIFFKKMHWQCHEKTSSYAPLPSFLVQRSKLSMQCNFSDHIVAFGSDSEWLSDIFTALLRLHQLSPVCFQMSSLLAFYQPSDNGITGGQAPSSTGLQWHTAKILCTHESKGKLAGINKSTPPSVC